MKKITLVGIDLAKAVFGVCGVNHQGGVVYRKIVRREKLVETVLELLKEGGVVAFEACGSSHYWGRVFREHGYKVKLIPPQHVRPFRKTQKNDLNDAEAVCEAALRPSMRFVEVKTQDELEVQAAIRIREQLIRERTATVNQLHAFLQEQGVIAPRGVIKLIRFAKALLAGGSLSKLFQMLVEERVDMLLELSNRLEHYTKTLTDFAKRHPVCRRLMTIPGIGALGAVAFVVASPEPKSFKNGRNFAAWLGLVPRQFSSGGKTMLGSITKRGDSFLRKTLVHGARAVLRYAARKKDPLSLWATALKERKGTNIATVALANRLARILCKVLVSGTYQAEPLKA